MDRGRIGNRPLRRPVFLFSLALALACPARPAPAATADSSAYADELVHRADTMALHEDLLWRNLLHYKKSWWGDRSLIDDPKFFLARDGKTNPRAELAATIRAFFQPVDGEEGDHPICRFVARFDWLKQKLDIDVSRLPMTDCAKFNQVRDYLQATSVTLVFPAAYMNGPASMFGHTLLVFDAEGKNRLLSRSVSYAAKTDERIGPLFAVSGIFGLYPGYYAIEPYYDKVEQYGDIGHRDVWEYELNFTPEEVDRMIRHAWELQNIYSRYYFFDENCSYNLYFFLDVARPELCLTDERDLFVIPINTVKAIDRKGLIRAVHYRPSPVTRIKHMASKVSPKERKLAADVARQRRTPASVQEVVGDRTNQVLVLDTAAEYTQYLYTERILPRESYSPRLREILSVRSKLGKLDEDVYKVYAPPRPDLGHSPLRLSFGAGAREDDTFISLRYRIAYHGLLDNDAGFDRGAQIQFLNTEARFLGKRDEAQLQEFDIVHVESLSPRSEFFNPGSWKFRAGLAQLNRHDERDELVFQVNTGGGLTYEGARGQFYFAMFEADGLVGGLLESDYALGLGPSAGLIVSASDDWKHFAQTKLTYFGAGDEFVRYGIAWGQDFRMTPDCTISLELSHGVFDGNTVNELNLRLNLYF